MHVVFVFVGVLRFSCLFSQRISKHKTFGSRQDYSCLRWTMCAYVCCFWHFDRFPNLSISSGKNLGVHLVDLVYFPPTYWFCVDKVIFFHVYIITRLYFFILVHLSFVFVFVSFFVSVWTGLVAKWVSIVSKYLFSVSFQNVENHRVCIWLSCWNYKTEQQLVCDSTNIINTYLFFR